MNEKLLVELIQLQEHIRELGYGAVEDRQFTSIINHHEHEQEDGKTKGSCSGCKDFETAVNRYPCSCCCRLGRGEKDYYDSYMPTPKPQAEAFVSFSDRKKLAWAFRKWADENRASYVAENVMAWGLSVGIIDKAKARQYLEGLPDKGGK